MSSDPIFSHYGQIEDRDAYRLKDRNNASVICFRCGTSALADRASRGGPASKRPKRSTSKATSTLETGKLIVSCDYCHLHWHLDCLDPPLASMPSYNRKWMCPNHVDHTLVSCFLILYLTSIKASSLSSNQSDAYRNRMQLRSKSRNQNNSTMGT